jgi:hypothetical protein
MIKSSLAAFGRATRDLFRRPGALVALSALYLEALACVYYFFSTGVANTTQLFVTGLTAVAAPLLFFILQAGVAHHARGAEGAGTLSRRALRDCWKILLVSLPLVALGVGLYYLLGWVEERLPKPDAGAPPPVVVSRGTQPPAPLRWQDVLASTLRLLGFGFALPLVAAHLWLSVAGEGLKATVRNFHRVVAAAFSARSVLVYAVGVVFFGLLPYFVVFTRTPLQNGWAELTVFGLRLALAFALTLWGWTITLAALASVGPAREEETPAEEPSTAGGETQPAAAGA